MASVHCFTSATYSYLSRVRVLGNTLKRWNPDWSLTWVLPDEPPPGVVLDLSREPVDRVIHLDELGISDLEGWIFQHNLVELCTAVKGATMLALLKGGADKVFYFDPDIAVFSDLTELAHLLDEYEILLTPHQLRASPLRQGVVDNEISSLRHGVYNLGFIGVANREQGWDFATWWRDRLITDCFDDVSRGLFTDQRWCDLVPAFFLGSHILRDEGCNVASWNLDTRPLRVLNNGTITAGSAPLKFFHFTKADSSGPQMIERYGSGNTVALELLKWYSAELLRLKGDGIPEGWWAYGRYADGSEITSADRKAYRLSADLRAMFRHPFDVRSPSLREHVRKRA